MKIAAFELEDWAKNMLQQEFGECILFENELKQENLEEIKDAEVLAVFIYSKVTKEVINSMPNLRMVATMSTGFDHIDTAYCKEKGIMVCNVPVYGNNTVAEHAFALILALARKIFASIRRTHYHHKFATDITLRGFDLKGKTLGIIGYGNIGKHVARIAKGFEMNVLVYDIHKTDESDVQFVEMDQLLGNSDIISLHVPQNESTMHMINEETINKMKHGVHIINTSRGGLIDTKALISGLQQGKIAGAALDVLEGEGEVKEELEVLQSGDTEAAQAMLQGHMLMKMDNVIVTPHNAFNSSEALQRILNTTIENIKGFSSGNPTNTV